MHQASTPHTEISRPLRWAFLVAGLMAGAGAGVGAGVAQAQGAAPVSGPIAVVASDAPGPVGGVPDKLPDLQLPSPEQLRLLVPRPVKAATAALGLGRQRLALVLGIGTLGSHQVLGSAPRDSLAVATALRSAGFVVMVREDATGTELRAALKEFRERLQPDGMGLLYATALGTQVDGRNLLLPRETEVDAAAPAAEVAERVRAQGVPVQELVNALTGTTESARMLVLDAAYKHPALDKLPHTGLAAQALPPGMMALFAQAPLAVQTMPAVVPLPMPAPTDPQQLAASTFARLLVRAVLTPKLSGAEVLRSTHRALVDSTQGAVTPWLAGDTDTKEEMAELTLLDAVLPSTPEDYTREGARRAMAQMVRPGTAGLGEQPVAEVLQQGQAPAASSSPSSTAPPTNAAPTTTPADNSRTSLPDLPANTSALGTAAHALGAAASVAGTVASVAGTAATVAVGVKAAQAVAAAHAASTAVGAATAVAGHAVALASRLSSGGTGEAAARQAVSAAAAAAPARVPIPAAARALVAAAGEMAVNDLLQNSPPVAAPATAATTPPAASPAPAADPPASASTDGRTTRNPEGGERPVYNPRSNRYGYAEGDTFSYQVTDTWKGEVTGRYTTAIEEVLDNGQMLANGQQVTLDAQGRLKSLRNTDGSLQRFEPHQDLWWSKPTPGQSRDVDFKEFFERADRMRGETQFKGSSSVGQLQKVQTPAGEFDALPIETSGWYHETLANGTRTSGKFERTVWYSPQLGHPVAIDIKDVDRVGKLLKRERVELTHAQQVRGAQ